MVPIAFAPRRFNMASSVNPMIQNSWMHTLVIFGEILQLLYCHNVTYQRLNITHQGISPVQITCTDRQTRSSIEYVFLCEQDSMCVALYKEWQNDGKRAHGICTCYTQPKGIPLYPAAQTKHSFFSIHSQPGRSILHVVQNHKCTFRNAMVRVKCDPRFRQSNICCTSTQGVYPLSLRIPNKCAKYWNVSSHHWHVPRTLLDMFII